MEKDDFLKICLSDPALVKNTVPLDMFTKSYCIVCSQSACARSWANNASFSNRVANWRKNLFDEVPRVADDDPRFDTIRAKKFLTIVRDNVPEVNTGPSSRYEVQTPTMVSTETQLPQTPVYSQAPVIQPAPVESETPVEVIPAPITHPEPQKPDFDLNNTPFQQGTIISTKPKEKEIFLDPGSTFTFGSDEQTDKK